jgi:hypothetical protein
MKLRAPMGSMSKHPFMKTNGGLSPRFHQNSTEISCRLRLLEITQFILNSAMAVEVDEVEMI